MCLLDMYHDYTLIFFEKLQGISVKINSGPLYCIYEMTMVSSCISTMQNMWTVSAFVDSLSKSKALQSDVLMHQSISLGEFDTDISRIPLHLLCVKDRDH